MKKSTILLIFIIYLASIVAIGFFGMRVKVYDEIKYVKSIDMTVEAGTDENEGLFNFEDAGIDSVTKNKKYKLEVSFDRALIGSFTRNSGIIEQRKYVPLILIPYVTYDTGDVANTQEESIAYSLSSNGEKYAEKEYISLSSRGELMCFKAGTAFIIYINPATTSGNGTGSIIEVYVI